MCWCGGDLRSQSSGNLFGCRPGGFVIAEARTAYAVVVLLMQISLFLNFKDFSLAVKAGSRSSEPSDSFLTSFALKS